MARSPDPDLAQKRRRQILDAALTCFARRGFHQATINQICTEAGLSTGAVYRYFPSKNDLILAIAEEDRGALLQALDSVGEQAGFQARMRAVAHVWLERIAERDRALIAEVLAEAARDPSLGRRLAQVDRPLRAVISEAVQTGQARGEVDPALDEEAAVRLVMAALDGMALRLLLFEALEPAQALADSELLFERFFAPRQGSRRRSASLQAEPFG